MIFEKVALMGAVISSLASPLFPWIVQQQGVSPCTPLVLREVITGGEPKIEGMVVGNEFHFRPLSLGEVTLEWQMSCSVPTEWRVQFFWDEEDFLSGALEQEGYHSQFLRQPSDLGLIGIHQAERPLKGTWKWYFPTLQTDVRVSLEPVALQPLLATSPQFVAGWRVHFPTSLILGFFQLRSAVTGYFPSFADTVAAPCLTDGDIFFAKKLLSECHFSAASTIFDQGNNSLYAVKNGVVEAFSSPAQKRYPEEKGDVLITEIQWRGSYSQGNYLGSDDWLELYNPGEVSIDLVSSRLRGVTPYGELRIPRSVIIPPKSFVIIGAMRNSSTSLSRNPDFVTLNIQLGEADRGIELLSRDGVLIDETPGGPWPFGGWESEKKRTRTLQKKWLTAPGELWSSWSDCLASQQETRCAELTQSGWSSLPGENLGSPWQMSVL